MKKNYPGWSAHQEKLQPGGITWNFYISWRGDELFEINLNSSESSQPLRDHRQISFVSLNGSNWIECQPRLNEKYKPALSCMSILRRAFCEKL